RAAALLDFLDHFLGGRRPRACAVGGAAGIVDHDLGAPGGAQERDLAADAAARARGDEGLVLPWVFHGGVSCFLIRHSGARSANPESRDSGSGPSDHPGMTERVTSRS